MSSSLRSAASWQGVPAPVIRAARKHLSALESQSMQPTPQFDLFSAPSFMETQAETEEADHERNPASAVEPDPLAQALLQSLDGIDPDALTPRQALDALYQLKALSRGQ